MAVQFEVIGVTDIRVSRVVVELPHGPGLDHDEVVGRWAGVGVEVRDRDLAVSRAVSLVFPQVVLWTAHEGVGLPAFWGRVADAFGAACARLRPYAAIVTDLPGPPVNDLVVDRERWLVAFDPGPLLGAGFARLYLSDAWFPDFEGVLGGLPYERVSLAGGPLLVGVDTDA